MARPRVEMLPAQRRAAILERLKQHGAATIHELAAHLGASASTVRRDLEYLEEAGYLERTHGGALLQPTHRTTFEPEPSIAAETAWPQKRVIGAAAAGLLSAGQSVIFDASTTVEAAAIAAVARGLALTAVTNSLDVAARFAGVPSVRLVVVGGSARPGSGTLTGDPGQSFLETVHADVALIGVHAITPPAFTETALEVAAMKQRMIAAARRVVVLADGTKFGAPSFATICRAESIDALITDDGAPADALAALRELGVEVTVVPADPGDGGAGEGATPAAAAAEPRE